MIGPYKIESLMGKGGMSFLYLALHPDTKQPIAIKVLSPSYVNHTEAVSRFLKEAQVIEITNHPNIIKLYGQGEWEKGLYIAMEFIHGVSLTQFITQHSLSIKRTLEVVLQVAYALLHLHSHGVIHRDLKPENILIDEEGEVKVIDFGIAQLHEERLQPEMEGQSRFLGTPTYMSPEQKENSLNVTFASDIYSLGLILFELITGKLSYGVVHLPSLPKGLRKIVAKALAVTPAERYQKVADFIQDISHYLNSGELEKERPGSDQVKELQEMIQRASHSLSPPVIPNWPQIDLGVAKGRSLQQIGLYYDFFRLPNNTFLALFASSTTFSIDSAVFIAALRGMIRMRLHEISPTQTTPFRIASFAEMLNTMVFEDILDQKFALSLLHLDPLRDQLSYLSCGFDSLLHIPKGEAKARKLTSNNTLLGVERNTTYSATIDNWNPGDILLMHSLVLPTTALPEERRMLEQEMLEATAESLLFSAQRQAEAILKKLSSLSTFSSIRFPKAILSLQRIV